MALKPFLEAREALRVRCRTALVVPHVAMGNRGPGLEGLVGAFDLFGNGDRHGRVVRLGRHAAGDRDADDAGLDGGAHG
jgi:hypothetical protein